MPNPSTEIDFKPQVFPWLARSRSMSVLWIVRMLVRFDAFNDLWKPNNTSDRERILQRLRLPIKFDETQREQVFRSLQITLAKMERNAKKFHHGRFLDANMALLCRQVKMTNTEQEILRFAVILMADEDVNLIADWGKPPVNLTKDISILLGIPASQVRNATDHKSVLRRSGLVNFSTGGPIGGSVRLWRGGFRKLATTRIHDIDTLFVELITGSPAPLLSKDDYTHLSPDISNISRILRDAIDNHRRGVNILFYGSPGTGKTELTRVLAKELGVPLYDVSSANEDGRPLQPIQRLTGLATAQHLMGDRDSLLCFDEIDAIFNGGSDPLDKPTTAESAKSWVNCLLEQNPVPTFWIANQIQKMDVAFLRRFDLVIKLETPPLHQRLRIIERECKELLNVGQMQRLAQVNSITPAVIARAAKVVRRINTLNCNAGQLLETVLDGTLRAQGHRAIKQSHAGLPTANYDIALCNANEDLARIADGIRKTEKGRICLYGPPGTGKTAFGHWLANTLGKPMVLKRISDIQSPYLGEMERKLAEAFEHASREQAVLQIDEVDSFLQDRRSAQRSWEISQVNEFLTQLESFDGIFIASTNLMNGLDQASLRRFDYKIHLDYLRPEQSWQLLSSELIAWGIPVVDTDNNKKIVASLKQLTLGDFALVARRHKINPFQTANAVIEALRAEIKIKGDTSRRIGFV